MPRLLNTHSKNCDGTTRNTSLSQMPTGEPHMTPENSSLLGYVFIIIGIGLGIIAYAIYLNLRTDKSVTRLGVSMNNPQIESIVPVPTHVVTPINSSESEEPNRPETGEPPEKFEDESPEIDLQLSKTNNTGASMPEYQELASVATFLREVDTGNLIIRIGETDYSDVEALKNSPHWNRMERLSLDLAEWLIAPQRSRSILKTAAPPPKSINKEVAAPLSMVEEINQILEEKLKSESAERKAIKIIEGLDGSVKVYVGVESYPIDEVPFEDVRELIRQAVAEWEESR